MYDFVSGPLVWAAFAILILGGAYRVYWLITYSKRDKVVHPYMTLKHGFRSVLHFSVPFGARVMRLRPLFTIVSFLFHICLLVTPIFALGHTLLWRESWGINLWSLPEWLTTVMAAYVVLGVVFFGLRRIAERPVRYVTSWKDYALLVIVGAPFATGIMAHYHVLDYQVMIVLHIVTGVLWLAVIPFSRVVHMLFYPFTRAYMGSEFGYVRGSRDW